MTSEQVQDYLSALLLVAGSAVMVLGVVGLVRMPDVYTRVQASSKTSTLGLAMMFTGIAVHFGDAASVAQAIAVVVFAFLSVPVAAHMIIRGAHGAGIDPWTPGARDDLREQSDEGHEGLDR